MSIDCLPVEVLHRLFDDLDLSTLFFAVRQTCRHLRAVVNSYNRFSLHAPLISRRQLELLCRSIDPASIRSLTLNNDDQPFDSTALIFSYFQLRQLTCLQVLSVVVKKECQLKSIFKRFNGRALRALSIQVGIYDGRCKTCTAKLLSSTLSRSNLRRLEFNLEKEQLERIVWPTACSLRCLKLDRCLPFDQLSPLLLGLPHLTSLILTDFKLTHFSETPSTPFRQLTSLTLEKVNEEITDLEAFLSLTPSLVHLKLIGDGNYCYGSRWEGFIRRRLPRLTRFEFFFNTTLKTRQYSSDIHSTIVSFQTPFWLDEKKWFVVYESDLNSLEYVRMYSIPICVSTLLFEMNKITVTTFSPSEQIDPSNMDQVETIRIDWTKRTTAVQKNEECRPLFRRVKTLDLEFDAARLVDWRHYLSQQIDLSTLVCLKVSGAWIRSAQPDLLDDLTHFCRQTSSLTSLKICYDHFYRRANFTGEAIGALVPRSVKDLSISLRNADQIPIVLERLPHLSSAHFYFDYTRSWQRLTHWLQSNREGATFRASSSALSVWLADNDPAAVKINPKRLKLTDEKEQQQRQK